MTDEELFNRKERLEYLYKRTKNKRIRWKLNHKLILLELEVISRGY
jgi:hypothetical protein